MKSFKNIISIKCLVMLGVVFLLFNTAKSQDTSVTSLKWEAGFEGMLAFSVGNNFYAFNVGGPAFQYVFNKNLKVGVGAFPSFYVLDGKTGARLGVSPRIDYKNLVFIS